MQNKIQIPDDVYYLVHMTKNTKYKKVDGTFAWKYLKPSSLDSPDSYDQFPGVYFTLITKDNLISESLFPYRYGLLFSRNLLKQFNYHINISDNNGMITETNTYFPWNLSEAVAKINANAKLPRAESGVDSLHMNEVIFHDPIPMEFCIRDFDSRDKELWRDPSVAYDYPFENEFLPDYPLENNVKPNTQLLPFYCFTQSEVEETPFKSSPQFYSKLAEVCNVDPNLSKEEINLKIQEKIPFFQLNRNKQNLSTIENIFKKIGGGTRKRLSKSKSSISSRIIRKTPHRKRRKNYTKKLIR